MRNKTHRFVLKLLLSMLVAPAILLAQEDPVQVIPQMWFTEGGEFLNRTFGNNSGLQKASVVGIFEEQITDENNHYILKTEFSKKDPQAIFVIFLSGRILKYDFVDRVKDWEISGVGSIRDAVVSADETYLAVATESDIQIIRTADGLQEKLLDGVCIGLCLSVRFSSDRRFAVVGDANGNVHIVDIGNPVNSWHRKMHDWPLRKLMYIEIGQRRYLVTSDLSEIILYDMAADEVRRRMIGNHQDGIHKDFWVSAFAVVPETNYFVVGGYSDIFVVDAATGLTVSTLVGATQPLLDAYVSPDLRTITGVSRDHVIYNWSVDTGAIMTKQWMETSRLSSFVFMSQSSNGLYSAVAALEPQLGFPPRLYNRVRIYRMPR